MEYSKKTESSFDTILISSDETYASANDISQNIQMQIRGFEQILLTMKHISESAQNFASTITTSSSTAEELSNLVESLNNLTQKR
jgi:methyl-accepting chemotaxis protein